MKDRSFRSLIATLAVSAIFAGCANMSPTLKGGAIGAGVGAATGAAAGAILGEPGKGAGVGAVVGGIAGLLFGEIYSQNKQAEANTQRPSSESYSTTLPSSSAKTQNEPLLLVNSASQSSDKELARIAMVLMGDILTSNGIKFEEYTVSSVAKYPKSPVVYLLSVNELSPTTNNPHYMYQVTLKLSRPGFEPQYFSGSGKNFGIALSQALFGK